MEKGEAGDIDEVM